MARKKKGEEHAGGHGWFVTFADLMGLLLAYFVMLVAFSQPKTKEMAVVAGSIREAFGNQKHTRTSGMIDVEGVAPRRKLANVAQVSPDLAGTLGIPTKNIQKDTRGEGTFMADRGFTTAAATLRQALQEMPEIAEISRNIQIEETPEGLDIQIVDQEGRSMFPEAEARPYERTRRVVAALAPTLRKMPNRIRITGHTSANRGAARERGIGWQLSSERALSIRGILSDNGLPDDRFESVVGRADTQPVFPDNPFLAPNRRVSILLVSEAPPLPPARY
ncbi:MAG: flagellar motor protein MotB [Proteobacteria bacterium]|nr:flagellar motor protein MotB [Pseudomonadota bacterium]